MITELRWPSALSPFGVRSFRFQWLADLMTSWAFEMETVILGWYIVVKTQSVLLVTLFGSLQYLGTLIAPLLGLAGDSIGHRTILLLMRASFVLLSLVTAALALADLLTPTLVLAIAAIAGLLRPSDTGIRNVLISETIAGDSLLKAVSLSRITMDSARVFGALAGGGIVAGLGLGRTYPVVVSFYLAGMLLTFGVGARLPPRHREPVPLKPSPFRDLQEAARAVWRAPSQLAIMVMAFVVNVTGYPFTLGLLPYVARDVYGTSQIGLGYLVASVASGCILASLILSVMRRAAQPARMVLVFSFAWHGLLILFGQIGGLAGGLLVLPVIGVVQMLCVLPMSVLLLRDAPPALRGRIMGMRTLAVYGLPIGLLCSGPLIDSVGFPGTAALYGALGILATLLVLLKWRRQLWSHQPMADQG